MDGKKPDDFAAGLFACWEEIQHRLSPSRLLLIGNEIIERPSPPLLECTHKAETKKRTWLQYFFGKSNGRDDDVALLHALGSAETRTKNNFLMPDPWVRLDDHYARLFDCPKSFIPNETVWSPTGLFVAKSGHHLIARTPSYISKISIADGKVVYSLDKTARLRVGADGRWHHIDLSYVHLDGTFWFCHYYKKTIFCYTEDLKLVARATRNVKFYPTHVAFLKGVMIVVGTRSGFSDDQLLAFYEPGVEEPIRVIENKYGVTSLAVCHSTNEIFVCHGSTISVHSAEGDWRRDIVLNTSYVWAFAITDDEHMLVCEHYNGISVWTLNGDFLRVCKMASQPTRLAVLPRGRVAVGYTYSTSSASIEIF